MVVVKRTGLHRLDCESECGAYVYATVSQLEQHGLPVCNCGARFVPQQLELTLHLLPGDDAHRLDVETELELQVSRSARGQMRATGAGHRLRSMGRELTDPYQLAAVRMEEQRRAEAHRRRVSGLRRGQLQPQPGSEAEIPF